MRIMEKLDNQKGSTLLFVVITVAILSMLGTALLAMSLMNINMKHNDNRIKKTLYYAESGIDQVYARVGKIVENSISIAIENTDQDIKKILEEIDKMLDDMNLREDDPTHIVTEISSINHSDIGVISLTALIEDDMLKTDALKTLSDELYRYHFRETMNQDGAQDALRDFLKAENFLNLDTDLSTNYDSADFNINVDAIEVTVFSGPDSTYRVKGIESKFVLGDHTQKKISTDILVSDQVKSYPLNTIEKRILVPDNPIWQKALVAQEDISFNSGTVDIHGDVYGYGNVLTGDAIDEPKNYGGFLVKGSSDVTVHGNIFSRSYVQLADGNDSAQLTVNNGLVYANSVVLQDGASGQMNFNGNVYTSDDLELNGTGGEININGNYYGYTDGSGTGISHDLSSAIVINADMNAGSSLYIDGVFNKVEVTTTKKDIDYLESEQGILIGGTAYVDVEPTRYQTGESVSLKGNFVAYTWGFDQETINLMKSNMDNHFNKPPYNFYSLDEDGNVDKILDDTELENKFLKDNVDWLPIKDQSVSFSDGYGPTKEKYLLPERKAYFQAFKHYIDGNSNTFIKTGPGINLQNYIFTRGLKLVYDDTVKENDFLDMYYHDGEDINNINESTYNKLLKKIKKDHIYQLHMLRHRSEPVPIVTETIPSIVPTFEDIYIVEKFTNLDTIGAFNNTPYPIVPSILNKIEDALEITYVNDATAQPLHIYGENSSGSDSPSIDITATSGRAQGIIVHNGDIIIHGNMEFAGPIIASGSIMTTGGNQSFKNNSIIIKNYLAKKIYNDIKLYNLFNVKIQNVELFKIPEVHIDELRLNSKKESLEEIEFIEFDNSTTLDLNNNSAYRYSDLMRFEFWKVEE